jgi:nucleolar protein 12
VVLKSEDTVADVLALNGAKFGDHHLRFDRTDKEVKYDPKRTIFVGNLHFDCGEEELRRLFAEHITGGTAAIESVRIVRDRATHKCKGIAFVLFRERTHVAEALGLRDIKLKGRDVRISRCSQDGAPLPYASAKGTKKSQSGVAKQTKFMGERGDDKVRAPRPKKSGSKRDSAGGKGKGKPFNKKSKGHKGEGKPAAKKEAAGDE